MKKCNVCKKPYEFRLKTGTANGKLWCQHDLDAVSSEDKKIAFERRFREIQNGR
jgi:hypothetical protein